MPPRGKKKRERISLDKTPLLPRQTKPVFLTRRTITNLFATALLIQPRTTTHQIRRRTVVIVVVVVVAAAVVIVRRFVLLVLFRPKRRFLSQRHTSGFEPRQSG